jgi:hypothetical protein
MGDSLKGARPFKRTTAGDFFDTTAGGATKNVFTVAGMKLSAGAAAATAQITDGNGTVLADLAAPINGADWQDIPVLAEGKVSLAAIAGAGASVIVYVD